MERKEKIAVFAGAFDPITSVYLHIIDALSAECEKIIVKIINYPEREYLFSVEERKNLIRRAVEDYRQTNPTSALNLSRCLVEISDSQTLQASFVSDSDDSIFISGYCQGLEKVAQSGILRPMYEDWLFSEGLDDIQSTKLMFSPNRIKNRCAELRFFKIRNFVPEVAYQALVSKNLEAFFKKTFQIWWPNDPEILAKIWADLKANYEKRAYHNFSHIAYMLELLAIRCKNMSSVSRELIFSIFIHDYILDETRRDNEEMSFASMAEYLPKMADKSVIEKCVLATKHDRFGECNAAKLIADLDLSILGSNSVNVLRAYQRNIRNEYKSVSNEEYQAKRRLFLQSLIDRKNIFQTEFFQNLMENQARENILAELA